jgi:hypothetical protein
MYKYFVCHIIISLFSATKLRSSAKHSTSSVILPILIPSLLLCSMRINFSNAMLKSIVHYFV